jgi:hypothetical protein
VGLVAEASAGGAEKAQRLSVTKPAPASANVVINEVACVVSFTMHPIN